MKYNALTSAQQEQVKNLFHDEHFGKEPAWFDYNIDNAGNIGRRERLAEFRTQPSRKRGQVTVRLVEVDYQGPLTEAMELRREIALQVLAKHLYQIIQEKNPEKNSLNDTKHGRAEKNAL